MWIVLTRCLNLYSPLLPGSRFFLTPISHIFKTCNAKILCKSPQIPSVYVRRNQIPYPFVIEGWAYTLG